MRVLVTGAGGFLGRHVLRCLARHHIDAVAIGRRRPAEMPESHFVRIDLLARPDLARPLEKLGATHLLHLAWETEHGRFWQAASNFDWVDASVRLVQAFGRAGGRHVVAAGSCAEYDWSHGLCREHSTPLAPSSTYGTAKDAARRLLMAMGEDAGLSVAWARLFLLHGAGEDPRRLVPSLIDTFAGRRAPFPVNHGTWRDLLHASDAAEGLVALLRYGAQGAYNLSAGQPTRLSEVVQAIARRFGADPSLVLRLPAAPRRDEPELLVGESRRLQALGWQPRHPLASGLAETIEARLAELDPTTSHAQGL